MQSSGYVTVKEHWRSRPGEGEQKKSPVKKRKRKRKGKVSYLG